MGHSHSDPVQNPSLDPQASLTSTDQEPPRREDAGSLGVEDPQSSSGAASGSQEEALSKVPKVFTKRIIHGIVKVYIRRRLKMLEEREVHRKLPRLVTHEKERPTESLDEKQYAQLAKQLQAYVVDDAYLCQAVHELTSGNWPSLASFLYRYRELRGYFLYRLLVECVSRDDRSAEERIKKVLRQWTKILSELSEYTGRQ